MGSRRSGARVPARLPPAAAGARKVSRRGRTERRLRDPGPAALGMDGGPGRPTPPPSCSPVAGRRLSLGDRRGTRRLLFRWSKVGGLTGGGRPEADWASLVSGRGRFLRCRVRSPHPCPDPRRKARPENPFSGGNVGSPATREPGDSACPAGGRAIPTANRETPSQSEARDTAWESGETYYPLLSQ